MEEEMEELCAEGLATHGDPESCVDVPRGRGEALTGALAGRAIEPRNQQSGVSSAPVVITVHSCRTGRRWGEPGSACAGVCPSFLRLLAQAAAEVAAWTGIFA